MAAPPPSVLDANPRANRQLEIIRATIPFLILPLLAVALRFWSRYLKGAAIAIDDYMIVIGLVRWMTLSLLIEC